MNNLYKWGASTLLALSTSYALQAQVVGIGTNTPDNSAKLHIVDNNRGILIPQVSIPNINTAAPVTAPARGLLVWNNNATTIGGAGRGFYYWNDTQWERLSTGTGTDDQNLTGATLSGNNLTITIENGAPTTVDLTNLVNDADAVIGNEYNTAFALSGTDLRLTDGGGVRTVNLASLVNDADFVIGNEYNTGFALAGRNLTLTDGGAARTVDLTSLVNDADFVIGNEYNTGFALAGNNLTLTDGGGARTVSLASLNKSGRNGLRNVGTFIHLGGPLIENTTVSAGVFAMNFNLNSTGDFNIQDNGVGKFTVLDNGTSRFGGDVEWRDESTGGTMIAQLFDDGNDGRFIIREDNLIAIDLDANTQFVFNEQGLDRDFRVESDADAHLFFVDAGLDRVGIGTNLPAQRLHVSGGARVSSLAGAGNRMVIANANGDLLTGAIPANGDITGVIAGFGLTGGGTAGTVTLNAAADNGLYINAGQDRIRLGGNLLEPTVITQNGHPMRFNLNGTGDFDIQDNGVNKFSIVDDGTGLFGGDVYWRDENTLGTNLMLLSDDANDGRLRIMENGITSIDLDANTQFVFNEQGLDRDFRVESAINPNALRVDAANDRVGLGTAAPAEDLHIFRPDNDIARVYATGGAQGSGMFYAGQSPTYGGGFGYDGDGAPAMIGGTDRITFFRRDNNTDAEVISYAYNNSTVRVNSLAGGGNRMVIANGAGDLFTQAIPANGDITGVTAGIGLTGGGAAGTVTINAAADNGLYINAGADRIRLGGNLLEPTVITQNGHPMRFNLNGTGDFDIQDNGVNKFSIIDNGTGLFGGDVYWRDENTLGTNLMILTDDTNDGRLQIMENGITSIDLDANTQFIFNEQGFDRNFRIESDGNANMFHLDAGLNRVSIGTNATDGTFNVQGNSFFADDLYLRDGAVNGGDVLVRIHDSADDGIVDVYQNNGINHRIHGNGVTVFNEQGNNNGDLRMESDTRTSMFFLDAGENLVRFGTDDINSDYQNGQTIAGVVVDYVVDFDRNNGFTGTAVGIGTIEYLLDNTAETNINNSFAPTTHLDRDLGFSTGARAWDDVYADNFVNVSDIREKDNIQNLNYGLAEIMQMRPVSYVLKRDPFQETKLGLIAQEALVLVPEAVKTHDHKILDESRPEEFTKVEMDRMGMTYQQLIPVLIKATQEQQAQIEALKAEIEALKADKK